MSRVLAALLVLASPAAAAQPPTQETAPQPQLPPQGPKNGVVTPPAQIDPKMTKTTPDQNVFPTPVIPPTKQAK